MEGLLYFLLALSIVMGMRSVGIVLISAMLIAPAAAARQWVESLGRFFSLSAFFGIASGFLGNAFSIWIPQWVNQPELSLPTGPMIVLSATSLVLFSLIFAPKKGFLIRKLRLTRFRMRCAQENILKSLYKGRGVQGNHRWLLWRMRAKGWIKENQLTSRGRERAQRLVRLHRLWEVYLVHMGQGLDRVHHSAEEMEHILTPEIEKELERLLSNPKKDPHHQPIPRGSP